MQTARQGAAKAVTTATPARCSGSTPPPSVHSRSASPGLSQLSARGSRSPSTRHAGNKAQPGQSLQRSQNSARLPAATHKDIAKVSKPKSATCRLPNNSIPTAQSQIDPEATQKDGEQALKPKWATCLPQNGSIRTTPSQVDPVSKQKDSAHVSKPKQTPRGVQNDSIGTILSQIDSTCPSSGQSLRWLSDGSTTASSGSSRSCSRSSTPSPPLANLPQSQQSMDRTLSARSLRKSNQDDMPSLVPIAATIAPRPEQWRDLPISSSEVIRARGVSEAPRSLTAEGEALKVREAGFAERMPTLLQSLNNSGYGTSVTKASPKPQMCKAVQDCRDIVAAARSVFDAIDGKRHNSISKLDLITAVEKSFEVRNFLLPDIDYQESDYEFIFEEASSMFAKIANGRKRIDKIEFTRFFHEKAQKDAGVSRVAATNSTLGTEGLADRFRHAFSLMDLDADGVVSKLDLLHAVHRESYVSSIVFPGICHERVMRIKDTAFILDAVDDLFEKIASGKKRIDCSDFIKYLSADNRIVPRTPMLSRARCDLQRHAYRVLVIAPGFGQKLNPRQCQLVEQSGFQIEWLHLPNPEEPGFYLRQHLGTLTSALAKFRPNLVAGASKGGHYITALWSTGLWRGPTLLLNAHPSLRELPKNVPIVIAHGLNDDLYPRTRTDLEELVATGSPNMCFLYTTSDSGAVGGVFTRKGDAHNMETILHQDCLPRLMDAALSTVPEMYMMWSWREKELSQKRIEAEKWLGYSPEELRQRWASKQHRGLDSQKAYEVPCGCEEFQKVAATFLGFPKEQPFYRGHTDATWHHTSIIRIERIENGLQEEGSAQPYFESLQKSIEEQGISFEPGLHTRWAFHGTTAIDSIIENPMTGFQPLMSGTRLGSVWGAGTYFARDAKYVVDSNLCAPAADGSKRMLMCLLMTGMSCQGSPDHRGVLPFRQKPHRYNSSVDSLSSPEIFVMQHPGSAYPAYVVTFR